MDLLSVGRGLLGLVAILAIAFVLSSDKRRVNWRTVVAGLLLQLGFAFGTWEVSDAALVSREAPMPSSLQTENTVALGQLLYTKYVLLFQLAALILLVAMIGAIVLTLRKRVDVKRQDVLAQMYRDPATAIELRDVKPGQGL